MNEIRWKEWQWAQRRWCTQVKRGETCHTPESIFYTVQHNLEAAMRWSWRLA